MRVDVAVWRKSLRFAGYLQVACWEARASGKHSFMMYTVVIHALYVTLLDDAGPAAACHAARRGGAWCEEAVGSPARTDSGGSAVATMPERRALLRKSSAARATRQFSSTHCMASPLPCIQQAVNRSRPSTALRAVCSASPRLLLRAGRCCQQMARARETDIERPLPLHVSCQAKASRQLHNSDFASCCWPPV